MVGCASTTESASWRRRRPGSKLAARQRHAASSGSSGSVVVMCRTVLTTCQSHDSSRKFTPATSETPGCKTSPLTLAAVDTAITAPPLGATEMSSVCWPIPAVRATWLSCTSWGTGAQTTACHAESDKSSFHTTIWPPVRVIASPPPGGTKSNVGRGATITREEAVSSMKESPSSPTTGCMRPPSPASGSRTTLLSWTSRMTCMMCASCKLHWYHMHWYASRAGICKPPRPPFVKFSDKLGFDAKNTLVLIGTAACICKQFITRVSVVDVVVWVVLVVVYVLELVVEVVCVVVEVDVMLVDVVELTVVVVLTVVVDDVMVVLVSVSVVEVDVWVMVEVDVAPGARVVTGRTSLWTSLAAASTGTPISSESSWLKAWSGAADT
mmetsp:Transcript_23979/g.72023  ORF Transcript_23979/g.72023 Transcript_23979/m.72023 type:complete len:382 (-) Transcript_23979:1170-2315(-)